MIAENMTSYFFYSLLFIYPFFPLIKEKINTIGNAAELLLIVALFLGSIFYGKGKKIGAGLAKSVTPLLFFTIVYLILGSSDYYDSFSAFRVYLLYISVTQLFLIRSDIIDYKKVITILMLTCIVMSLGAVLQFINPSIITNLHTTESLSQLRFKSDFKAFSVYNRAISFMLDPNILSIFLCFNMMAIIQFFKSRDKNFFFIFTIVLSLIGCALSQSRTGLIVIITYLLFQFFQWIVTTHKVRTIGFFVFFVAICVCAFWLLTNFQFILQFLRVDTLLSANGRTVNSQNMWRDLNEQNIVHFLFGNGLTTGRNIIFENSYLLCFYSFGLIGSIAFLICFFALIIPLINRNNWIPIICFAIVNIVGDYLLIPQVTLYALLCLGIPAADERSMN